VLHSLAAVAFLVPSYDEGLGFFRDGLGFEVVEDTDLGQNKRWVAVAPLGGRGATLILAVPSDRRQRARIGDQTGGRVGYFLLTNDFHTDYEVLRARGVRFLEEPQRALRPSGGFRRPLGRQVGFARTDQRRWRRRMSSAR
jgi:catechol 2,3-dioxygenase-like lactoylglutathione lyase family enzyme